MKILNTALSGLGVLIMAFLVFLAYGSVNNRFYRVITVEGNSMAPTLLYGDLIVVSPPTQDIPLNTIILMNIDGSLVTHRVIGFDESGRPVTKGDANEAIDSFSNPTKVIVGIYRFRLPGFGYPLLILSSLMSKVF